MRAAILHAAGQGLHIVERERPTPGVGQVLVRVRACGCLHTVRTRNHAGACGTRF